MKLILSSQDLETIANLIADENSDKGSVYMPIEDIDTNLVVDFSIDSQYSQDLSYDGCGEYKCDYVEVTIGEVYVDGWGIEVDYNYNQLVKLTEEILREV